MTPSTPTDSQRRGSVSSADGDEDTCWVCYGGDDEKGKGGLISPCDCRGSVRWVHEVCLRRWVTTRSTTTAQWSTPNMTGRFACPNCKSPYKISKEDEVSMEDGKVPLAMPRKFGMLPDFKQLGLVDNDLVDSFKWRTLSVAFVAVMWSVLVIGSLVLIGMHQYNVQVLGQCDTVEISRLPRPFEPLCRSVYRFVYGIPDWRPPPLRFEGSIGRSWSRTFQQLQGLHNYVFLANFLAFMLGLHHWVRPVDLAFVPFWIRRHFRPHSKCFMFLCMNPPLLNYLRASLVAGLVFFSPFPDLENMLVYFVYGIFTSVVDVALHLGTSIILSLFWARACWREHGRILTELDTIWRMHNLRDVHIVGQRRS
jgi:hypothetical protein